MVDEIAHETGMKDNTHEDTSHMKECFGFLLCQPCELMWMEFGPLPLEFKY